jgi:hypothetical protein
MNTMDLTPQQHDHEAKKPYVKPEVTRFPLRPEEAVLGFCKSHNSPGSNGANCFIGGICSSPGS